MLAHAVACPGMRPCYCCGRRTTDVSERQTDSRSALLRPLCDACWDDLGATYADCRHGGEITR